MIGQAGYQGADKIADARKTVAMRAGKSKALKLPVWAAFDTLKTRIEDSGSSAFQILGDG
ncbi:hypothetical protein [Diaphorobacter aerolatus]|uniref:Uncharacterized protein n=1 Tax=Diaphorobacter aerolatus TaxID=1288495 RepID=A0A7H0GGF9_9BURK|nr:hypothetical protein [Diaphorobacter aerolatus]QNP47375.1 hypothetical protein H9K75_13615 [Diaphorobacter aerolatus]